jgi:hypothetical protein
LLFVFAFVFPFGVWGAAVDAFEAADRMRAGTVEGGFILRDECISRIIKFDSKQKTSPGWRAKSGYLLSSNRIERFKRIQCCRNMEHWWRYAVDTVDFSRRRDRTSAGGMNIRGWKPSKQKKGQQINFHFFQSTRRRAARQTA